MRIYNPLKIITSIILCLLLTACDMTPLTLPQQTSQGIDDVQAQLAQYRNPDYTTQLENPTSSSALLPPARWLTQPTWMNNRISMHGQNMPFSFWVSKALAQTGAAIGYQDGMNKSMVMNLDYTGTVRGALDKLAATTGYGYTVDGNNVTWAAFVSKTFDVSFIPGASQYMMGGQSGGGSSNTGGSSGTGSSTMVGETMNNQFSNMQGTLSVWTDLENTIKSMLSKDGSVIVSQATTTVTVRDRPQNVRLIGDYLASMNKDLSREVALQVQVLQITLNKAFSYGIDWNLVKGQFQIQGGAGGLSGTGVSTTLGGDLANVGGISANGLGWGILPSGLNKVLINALAQQGKLSVVTQPRVVTLNNQVAQIAITSQQTYLASVTSTSTALSGTNSVSLTPGEVTTGFTLYVLPKIMNKNVYLQLTSELSSLDSLTTFSSTPTTSTSSSTSSSSGSGSSQIQEPTVSSKSFNQRTMVPSGATLVLAGFKQVKNESDQSSIAGLVPLGGVGAQQINTETLVLITPLIVGDNGG